MSKCKKCGSFAINPHMHNRDDTDLDLCDVCYWIKRANISEDDRQRLIKDNDSLKRSVVNLIREKLTLKKEKENAKETQKK